jgi:hypothetical protein
MSTLMPAVYPGSFFFFPFQWLIFRNDLLWKKKSSCLLNNSKCDFYIFASLLRLEVLISSHPKSYKSLLISLLAPSPFHLANLPSTLSAEWTIQTTSGIISLFCFEFSSECSWSLEWSRSSLYSILLCPLQPQHLSFSTVCEQYSRLM